MEILGVTVKNVLEFEDRYLGKIRWEAPRGNPELIEIFSDPILSNDLKLRLMANAYTVIGAMLSGPLAEEFLEDLRRIEIELTRRHLKKLKMIRKAEQGLSN